MAKALAGEAVKVRLVLTAPPRGEMFSLEGRDGVVESPALFRAELPFPSRLPEGVYDVRTYLLRDGKIVAAVSRPLPVGKVGFSAQLAGWAVDEGPLYGAGAIVMALVLGWLGGAVLRRL